MSISDITQEINKHYSFYGDIEIINPLFKKGLNLKTQKIPAIKNLKCLVNTVGSFIKNNINFIKEYPDSLFIIKNPVVYGQGYPLDIEIVGNCWQCTLIFLEKGYQSKGIMLYNDNAYIFSHENINGKSFCAMATIDDIELLQVLKTL